jgi:hypothetical protein
VMCEKNATPIGMDFPVSSNPFFVTAMLRASCFVQKSYTCKKKMLAVLECFERVC